MATGGSLAAAALRAALSVSPGEGWDGADAEVALGVINGMLAAWGADAFSRPTPTLEPLTLTANQQSYTVGAGGQMNTARPDSVEGAFLRRNGQDTPLTLLTREEYLAIPDKAQPGEPSCLYYDTTSNYGTLYVHPVPAVPLTLWLDSLKPLPQFATVATVLTLPGEYEEAVMYGAAERLCVDYGMPVTNDLRKLVADSKARLTRKNARVKLPRFDRMLTGPAPFNINTGR